MKESRLKYQTSFVVIEIPSNYVYGWDDHAFQAKRLSCVPQRHVRALQRVRQEVDVLAGVRIAVCQITPRPRPGELLARECAASKWLNNSYHDA